MNFLDDIIEECIDIVEKRFNFKLYPEKKEYVWDMLSYLKLLEKRITCVSLIYAGDNFFRGEYTICNGLIICGDNVNIGNYSYLRGPIILGDKVSVNAEIKNSIILSNSKINHRNIYVGDSIIGRNCNIGAGTQFANLRFDKRFIKVKYEGIYYETNFRKLGSLVEHNSNFSVNSSIPPGTYIKESSLWIGDKIR